MKKIIIVFLNLLLVFNIIAFYPAKAKAATDLVDSPGYLKEAFKATLTGVVAVGAIGATVYNDVVDNSHEFLENAWDTATPLVKEGFRNSMILANQGLTRYGELSAVTWNEITRQINGYLNSRIKAEFEAHGYMIQQTNNSTTITKPGSVFQINYPNGSKQNYDYLSVRYEAQKYDYVDYGVIFMGSMLVHTDILPSKDAIENMENKVSNISTPTALIAFINTYEAGHSLSWPDVPDSIYDPTLKRTMERDIPHMKDAGLVLPMPEAYHPSTNQRVNVDAQTGTMTLPDGTIYQGDVTWKAPPVVTGLDTLGNPAVGWTGTNVTTGETTWTNIKTGETTTTGGTTPPVTPPKDSVGTNPFKNIVPIALLLGLFDLLVALIWYLIRMFHFIVTIGLIAPTEINNPYFQWFQQLRILGIKPYSLTINLAIFFLGFSIYKSVRRVFG